MTLPNPATFYHRTLFERHGRFDECFRITGDYEFLLRELPHRDALFIPHVVAVVMTEGGLSSDPRLRVQRLTEVATARYRHGPTGIPPWASWIVIKARIRAGLERALGPATTGRIRGWYGKASGRRPTDL
jgi:hypothetical protein